MEDLVREGSGLVYTVLGLFYEQLAETLLIKEYRELMEEFYEEARRQHEPFAEARLQIDYNGEAPKGGRLVPLRRPGTSIGEEVKIPIIKFLLERASSNPLIEFVDCFRQASDMTFDVEELYSPRRAIKECAEKGFAPAQAFSYLLEGQEDKLEALGDAGFDLAQILWVENHLAKEEYNWGNKRLEAYLEKLVEAGSGRGHLYQARLNDFAYTDVEHQDMAREGYKTAAALGCFEAEEGLKRLGEEPGFRSRYKTTLKWLNTGASILGTFFGGSPLASGVVMN